MKISCETFIDVFILFCIVTALTFYLFTKKSNFKRFSGQKTTIRGFGTQGNPTNPAELGLAASNFSGGGVVLPVENYTSFTKWGEVNPYNSQRELTLKQSF